MIVTLQFGVTPEKMKAACEKAGLGAAATDKLATIKRITADIHVDAQGAITGGHISDMVRSESAAPKVKQPITIETVLAAYRHTKDVEIDALEKQLKELKALQAKREEWFNVQLTKNGLDQFKKKGLGTVFYTTANSVTIADRTAFVAWIKEDIAERFDFLDVKANKDQALTRLEDEGTLPPGLNHSTFKKISVRKG